MIPFICPSVYQGQEPRCRCSSHYVAIWYTFMRPARLLQPTLRGNKGRGTTVSVETQRIAAGAVNFVRPLDRRAHVLPAVCGGMMMWRWVTQSNHDRVYPARCYSTSPRTEMNPSADRPTNRLAPIVCTVSWHALPGHPLEGGRTH